MESLAVEYSLLGDYSCLGCSALPCVLYLSFSFLCWLEYVFTLTLKLTDMGLILWGFFLAMLFLGIKPACWLYGGAIFVGACIGIYKRIKQNREYDD